MSYSLNSEKPVDDQSNRPSLFKRIWQQTSDNAKGCIWLILASLLFAIMTATIKGVGQRIPVWEILFIRQIAVIAILSPQITRKCSTVFKTKKPGLHFLRVLFSLIAMGTGFTAVVYIPLADEAAISFSRTLFITLLAVFILKEEVDVKRWGATLVGFLGVLIVLQPSFEGINFYAGLAMISAVFVALIMIVTRMMTRTESDLGIMTYQSFGLTIAFAPPAIYFWQTPTLTELLLMLSIGVVMTLAQYANIQAYRNGEASAVQPMEYTRLIFAGLIGIALFEEFPSTWTIVGSLVIFVGAIYSVREMQKEPKSRAPSSAP